MEAHAGLIKASWFIWMQIYPLGDRSTTGGKVSKKGLDSLLLCTLPNGDGWLVWDLSLRKEVKSHDVICYEDSFAGLGAPSKNSLTEKFLW